MGQWLQMHVFGKLRIAGPLMNPHLIPNDHVLRSTSACLQLLQKALAGFQAHAIGVQEFSCPVERAIALDPQLDLAYHVLGRWHLGVATVNPLLRFGARLTVGALPPASLEEAARNLEMAAKLSPKTIIHHQHLALAYQALGKRNEAANQWRMVLELPATDREDEEAKRQARAALGR